MGRVEAAAAGGALAAAAQAIYSDLRLVPLLRALLTHSGRALAVPAGSVSLVSAGAQVYSKVAERGAACGLGRTFPCDEGVTGQVLARGGPVLLPRYSALAAGHLPAGHPAQQGAVAAVPIWWRGEVIGAHVAFAERQRRFTTAEVDQLELLSQVCAPAIVHAVPAHPALGHLVHEPTGAAGRGRQREALRPAPAPGEQAGAEPTRREQEVLALVARGLSDREVADALVLSRKTVEKHVSALLRKTGARSRTGAVVQALEQGWLT